MIDVIKDLLLAAITEEQEELLFKIDQEPELSLVYEEDFDMSTMTAQLDEHLAITTESAQESLPLVSDDSAYIWVM
jgi:hypothetical protein